MSRSPTRTDARNFPVSGPAPSGAYEQVFVPHLGDALRLVALVAVPVTWIVAGPLSAWTMLLVSGGTWAFRYYARTRSEDLAGQAVLLAGGAFSVLGTYKVIGGLDLVVHLLMLGILTKMLANLLIHHGMLPEASTRRQGAGILLAVTGMGVMLAVLWEIGEWFGHTFINPDVGVGYADTLGDLAAGFLGALGAAAWFHASSRRSGDS